MDVLAESFKGACSAREKRVALQVYTPLCALMRTPKLSGSEVAVGGPTTSPPPLDILWPSELYQLKMGVL